MNSIAWGCSSRAMYGIGFNRCAYILHGFLSLCSYCHLQWQTIKIYIGFHVLDLSVRVQTDFLEELSCEKNMGICS